MKPQTKGPTRPANTDLVNELIPNGQFLVIDENGTKLGTFDRNQALAIANDRGVDIFVVSADAKPMVAKLLDYSKYRFDQQKKLKEMRKNQHIVKIKEIKLSPTIDKHDFDTKLKAAQKFINGGDKVKVTLRFRGRMITHSDLGMQQVVKFMNALEGGVVEAQPKLEGNTLIGVVAPAKN
ncbi:translation initiation factor IF-3 [Acholeplasma equirhinis]|uniref:translation initiation factor IF-3 n=1 Tax=Acholeplasma equirhinis TaxID=555393 RepID=UPI00197A83D1|nr:translation initiation factor IF-3 [Acholeplasma equirhinis]MBN3490510.1 translation initiation factor IF-3 [Acholeplasma equirhinis]